MGRIRDEWRAVLDHELDVKEEAKRICAYLKRDEWFCEMFLEEALCQTVYEVGIGEMSAIRTAVATRIATAEEIADVMAAGTRGKGGAWDRWLERDPASGRHVPILAMTKAQLLAAAREREGLAKTQVVRADFNRALANQLNDTQTVGDVWSTAEMDTLYARVRGSHDDGLREVA